MRQLSNVSSPEFPRITPGRRCFAALFFLCSSQVMAGEERTVLGLSLLSADNEFREREEVLLLPQVELSLGNFFISGDQVGYYLLGEDDADSYWSMALVTQARTQHYRASDAPQLAGMGRREATMEIGPAFSVGGTWGNLGFQLTQDVLDRSGGASGTLSYAYEIAMSDWTLTPHVSLEWLDKRTANYYYGVKPDEARARRPAYRLSDGQQWSVGYELRYRLSEHWQFQHGMSHISLEGDARNSPLLRRPDYTVVSLGVAYAF